MAQLPRVTLAGLFLGFLLFVAPSEANQCRTGCHGIHASKAYQEGRTYTYQLDGESVTSVTDAQGEATFKLNAIVELFIKPDCVHQIRLKNVKINGASASQGEIERHAVQFNYHNGHVDTEICAEPGDTQSSLNVKRAVISLLQDAVVQDDGSTVHSETDIFGACPTDFTFSKNGESRTIKKYRNLEDCSYRENIKQDLITGTFNPNSDVKSTPLLAAELKVEQQFNRGVLSKAISVETYKFKPFSNGDAGAKTVVETTLTFTGESGGSSPAQVSEPKSLIFEAPHQVVRSSVDAITRALKTAGESMPDAVTLFAARRFAELVKVLRQSSDRDILTVYSRVKAGAGFDKDSSRKVLLDALFRTGTGEAAQAVAALIKNKEITPVESIIYYTSLIFVRHSSIPSITAVASLLDQPDLPRIAYLGIGSLIGKYCQEHACEDVREVNGALSKLTSKLARFSTREQEDVAIAALKGLGNARYLDDATMIKIANIAASKNNHNRVRVAALEALPTRCSMKWKNIIIPTFADREDDSEIRIKAYLSLVACPCSHVASHLKEVLDKETIYQVGSFITSHLRNLRASTNPDKQEAKYHLGLIKPRTKFPEDFRKFSFNNEFSYDLNAFGFGSSVESNVIYSQNSFVPRSGSLNLTTEIFGHSYNFLQIDGRIENLDLRLEEYFGPKGILRPSNLKEVVLDGRKTYGDIIQNIANRFQRKVGRHARHVSNRDVENFGKQVHLPNTELNDEMDLDLSIKLFGAELGFFTYKGCDKQFPKNLVEKILNGLEDGVDKAKHFDYHFKNHLHFLDAELVYPTGLGFPLTLGVTGTSAVHLKTSGKIDFVAIYKNPQSAAFQIALEPSASVRIAGSMIIEGYGIESGLKVITTLHTATGTDISVKLLEGNGVDVNFGVPKQKQELITVTSEVLVSSGPKGDNYVAPKFTKGQDHSDCFDQLADVIGFSICGKISYPYDSLASVQKKPIFPLSGPASFSIYLQNNDVRNYHFKVFYNSAHPKARSFEILLETPNSRTNRRVSLLVEAALEPEKLVRVVFDSPWKKASIEGVIKNNANEQTFTLTVHHDNIEYFVRTGIVSSGNKYRPVLEYKVPDHVERLAGVKNGVKNNERNGQQYTVGGAIEVKNQNGGKKYVFDRVSLVSSGQALLSVDGNVGATSTGGNADLKVEYGGDTYFLKGNVLASGQLNFKTELSVVPMKNKDHGISISFENKGNEYEGEEILIFVHGSDLNSQTNRLTYHGKHKFKYVNVQNFEASIERKITYPVLGLVVQVDGGISPKSLDYDVEFKYAKFNFESELSAKTGIAKQGDFEVEFDAKLQANSIEFKTTRVILGDHKDKFTTCLELHPGGKYEIDAVIDHVVKSDDINTHLTADLKINGKKVSIDTGLESNPNKVNSRAIVNYENTKYLEFTLAVQRGTNPNGNFKLNLKNYMSANGKFKYQKGSAGDAQFEIYIPKFNRKITGHGEATIAGSKHIANFEVLYDAAKDPQKRIKVSSENDFTSASFNTKNNIEILNYKTIVNAKGTYQGRLDNGQQTAEFDITLPNGRYITGKGSRSVTTNNDVMDGQVQLELVDHETRGGKSRKLIYHPEVHDLNIKTMTYRAKHDLQLINFNGEDVHLVIGLKNLPNGPDKKSIEFSFDLSGSRVPSPFSLHLDFDAENEGAYSSGKIRSSLGNNLSLQANGNFIRGNNVDKPMTAETTIEIKLPSDKLKSIKLQTSETILISKENGRFEYIEKSQLTYNDDKTIKLDTHFTSSGIHDKTHIIEGTGKVTVTVLTNAPVTVGYNYKHDSQKEMKESSAGLNLNFGNKLTSIALDSTYSTGLNDFIVNIKAVTPIEKIRNVDLKLQHKQTVSGTYGNIPSSSKTDMTLIVEQVKYTLSHEFEKSDNKFESHVIYTSPGGKTEKITKVNKLGEGDYTVDYKWTSPHGLVSLDGHVIAKSIDDFSITINLDSDKLQTRRIHAEIANKLAKAGKRIVINVSSDGKNIIAGSTNYKKHSEGNKMIVEGNGSLKIHENTKSSSFKYTEHRLTADVDGENGVSRLLNINFGPSSIVSELKLTNKEMHVFNSYCEQSADCAQFNLLTKTTVGEFRRTQETTAEVDLRKFNVPYEFGLKSNQIVDLGTGFDSTANLYLHSSNQKLQYSYRFYGNPAESGIVVTLPSRELALIATFDIPKNKRTGAYKIDVSAYLDRKRRPKEKTSLIIAGDVALEKNSGSISGETTFSYPSHPKDLSVKGKVHFGGAYLLDGNLDIDIFETRNQKIVVTAKYLKTPINQGYNVTGTVTVLSQGQQLNVVLEEHVAVSSNEIGFGSHLSYTDKDRRPKSTGILFFANPQASFLRIHSPDQELVKVDSKIDVAKNLQKISSDVNFLNCEPLVISFEVKDLSSFKYLYQVKNNPRNRLEATGRFVRGQVAEVHADSYREGNKKELFHLLVHLDERQYLKPDFGFNKNNIAQLIDTYRTRIVETLKSVDDFIKHLTQEIVEELTDLLNHLKKAQPNLKPLVDHFVTQLTNIKNELNIETKGLKEIQQKINALVSGPIAAITDAIKKINTYFEEIQKVYADFFDRLNAAFKSTLPELQKSWKAINDALIEIFEDISKLTAANIKTFIDILSAHKDEFKQFAIIGSDLIHDVSAIIFKTMNKIQGEVSEFFTVLIAELKALPIYASAQQKYTEIVNMDVANIFIRTLDDLVKSVNRFLPTKALKDLVTSIHDYIVAHLRQQKVDDVKELKKLWSYTLQAVRSIIELPQFQASSDDFVGSLQTRLPFDFSGLSKLPGITSLRVSILSLIQNREFLSPADLFFTYRPSIHPEYIITPFRRYASFMDGGHFFTFDGRHLTYPGKCSYVLSLDARDGNFSVVAELNDGKLTSVTVTEPTESVTIQSNGAIFVNNQPADSPASTKNLHVYVRGAKVQIFSDYGLELDCNRESPMLCGLYVSGFYHGRLRGILGNSNNEPYDDFTLPSGKISENEVEFGHSFRVNPQCPRAQSVPHHSSHRSTECNKLFTAGSPLSACFNFVDPTPYRQACEHSAITGPEQEGPCLVAIDYHLVCREAGVWFNVPNSCGSCQVGNQKININDAFSVQHPKKQADLIFVLEQATENADVYHKLIVPLMNVIKSELRDHGITDVHIGLIGFGDQLEHPVHYTLKGSLNVDKEVKNIKFANRNPSIDFEAAKAGDLQKRVEFLAQKLAVELGTFKLTHAYEEALAYEFRPGASKTIIGVIATPCEKSVLPISLQQLRLFLGHKAYNDLGLTYHQIATLDDILISGKPMKNVVGFDSDSVFTFADSRKRPVEGNADLRNKMVVTSNDVCASFAANSGGAAFSAHNFLTADTNKQKQFIQVAGRRLVSSLVNTEIKEDCVCKQRFGFYPRAECNIVSRKEKEPVARSTKGGVKG